jgi:hypothetical protein
MLIRMGERVSGFLGKGLDLLFGHFHMLTGVDWANV